MSAQQTRDESIVNHLIDQGFAITPNFLPKVEVAQLHSEALTLWEQDGMRRAGVGKNAEIREDLRGDLVSWLAPDTASEAQHAYLARLEQLRQSVNRTLLLGLFEFEGHLALYPPGAFYRKHIDQFQGNNQRTLTTILYLNANWHEEDGGELRIYPDSHSMHDDHENTHAAECPYIDILPQGGTLVTFISSRFWHEVLPAGRERISISGWFKARGAGSL